MLDIRKAPGLKETFPGWQINNDLLPCARTNRLLTTQDYAELFTMLERHDDLFLADSKHEDSEPDTRNRHCVLFGNSGIGKSYFLDYLIVRRVLQGKDTILVDRKNKVFAFNTSKG